jgi:hypothetical protein
MSTFLSEDEPAEAPPLASNEPMALGAPQDRRHMQRRSTSRPIAVLPVLLDGSPGELQWADAYTEDVSATGIALTMPSDSTLPSRAMVIGAESANGGPRVFATLQIVSQSCESDGFLRIGGRWAIGSSDDILTPEKLRPRVDPRSLTFVHGWSEEILNKWTRLGVLRRYLVDRVLLCGRCDSIPSWRNGCHVCGSGRIHRDRLIHHFACAHVDRACDFETADGLQCPKCRTASLIVGSDYEFIEGPVECFDCGARGGQPTMAAMCHRCHRRFSMDEAEEKALYAYHVERLDPLNFYAT